MPKVIEKKMDAQLTDLLVFDWKESLKVLSNNHDLAVELLELFVKNLPDDIAEVQSNVNSKSYADLLATAHKLHSGLCYMGFPRLKSIVYSLESFLLSQGAQKSFDGDTLTNLVNLLVAESQNIIATDFSVFIE